VCDTHVDDTHGLQYNLKLYTKYILRFDCYIVHIGFLGDLGSSRAPQQD